MSFDKHGYLWRTLAAFAISLSLAGIIWLVQGNFDDSVVSEALGWYWAPGMLAGLLFYPQGIHTGAGSVAYLYVGLALSVVFWAVIITVLVTIRVQLRTKRAAASP